MNTFIMTTSHLKLILHEGHFCSTQNVERHNFLVTEETISNLIFNFLKPSSNSFKRKVTLRTPKVFEKYH
jgi:hypothetical protein